MYALVNAFLRCLALLLPPPWLQLGIWWWVGDEHGKMTWPNPSARVRGRKRLTDQEVKRGAPRSFSSPVAHGYICPVASPPAPGALLGRVWQLWQTWICYLGTPSVLRRHVCDNQPSLPNFSPLPYDCASAEGTSVWSETALAANEEATDQTFGESTMCAAVETQSQSANPMESMRLSNTEEDGEQHHEMGTQVKITVAIQAAEDEEPDGDAILQFIDTRGGSCSEDDAGRHDKSSGAGTSGGEQEEESWQPPDHELTSKLVAQIEFYLSDENLEKDAFLLKHVRRNKLGYVSVKLLTSFKKVKHLTRDWRTTAFALRHSQLLELNEEGRKVRRKTPVPIFASENLPSRMLLVTDLHLWPELGVVVVENNTGPTQQEKIMEHLLKVFGAYGVISSVRILRPGKELPPDLKKLSGRYTQLGTSECAIVEFEEVDAAIKAHEAMGEKEVAVGAGEDENTTVITTTGPKVVLIGTKPPKKKVLKERQKEDGPKKNRSLNSRVRELQYLGEDSACSSSETESNPNSPRQTRKDQLNNKLSPPVGGFHQNNHLSPSVSPRSSPWNSPRTSPSVQRKTPPSRKSPLACEGKLSPEPGRKWADYSSDSSLTPSGSPWVQRRKQVASQESSPVGSPMLNRKIQNADGLPPGVVRLPRGPDGTKGFHNSASGADKSRTIPQE
ncbi:la-related protein 6a [Erpetoichthys calabaricus]|uniref:La ribonucleoprotein 6, translational regulator a n=1 Tax=Erpetoichthys calabaricus TaxID=27687 RepID=A0A8C4TIJ0_ERPCA|nr:la-related protein 6a [Erpetoichthys calabaricus]